MTRRRSTYQWETKAKQTTGIREEDGKRRKRQRNEREGGKRGKWRRKRDMQTEAAGQG